MLDIFHMNNTQCEFHNINYNLGIVSWKRFRKGRGFAKEEVSQSSKISVLPMSVIHFFDSSLNLLIFPDLSKSCRNDSLFGWFSNCWINFFTVSSPTSCSVTSVRCALVVWGCSCFLIRLILLPTLRIRLQYNSRQPWRLIYLMEKLLLNLHAYRSLNTNRR